MAKCKHWNYCMLDADLHKSAKCRGKDAHCNIIPKPAKVKKIRAWANITPMGSVYVSSACKDEVNGFKVPCTILISAKYLKGGK